MKKAGAIALGLALLLGSADAKAASASGTTIPGSSAQIIDAQGGVWTLSCGAAVENGTAERTCSPTTATTLLFFNNALYEQNSNGSWWSWNGTAWVPMSGDPRTGGTATGSSSGGTVAGSSSSGSTSSSSGGTTSAAACGTTNGQTLSTLTGTSANLCAPGNTVTGFTADIGDWIWVCQGSNPTDTAGCFALSGSNSGGGLGGSCAPPAAATAAGYTFNAMDVESWSASMIDMGTKGHGFPWYNDGYSGLAGTPNNLLTFANGKLTMGPNGSNGTGGIGGAAGTSGTASFSPVSGYVGNAYGPGFYMETVANFDPSGANDGNWPALWGFSFNQFFNQINPGGTEVDWAEFYPSGLGVPAYNFALHEWPGGASIWESNGDSSPVLPAGWNWNTPHTYGVLCVPSQDNGGTGYCQTYVDGNAYAKLTWTAGGTYSKLDTAPFIPIISPPATSTLTLGKTCIFVKDAAHVIGDGASSGGSSLGSSSGGSSSSGTTSSAGSGSTSSSSSGATASSSSSSSSSSGGTTTSAAACGTANGQSFSAAPTTNLCASGTVTGFTADIGDWIWVCQGSSPSDTAGCFALTASSSGSSSGGLGGSSSGGSCSGAGIMWGVNAHPVQGGANTAVSYADQMALLNNAGLKTYRMDVYNTGQMDTVSQVLAAAKTAGIVLLPVLIPGPDTGTDETGNYNEGHAMGQAFAAQFKNDIHVWELGNEEDIWTGITGDGSLISQYNQSRYVLARGMIHGLLDGIHAADPASQGMVDAAGWCHWGFQEQLWADGIHWDVTGWHWYSNYGDVLNASGCGNTNIMQKFHNDFGKPIWLTEFNVNENQGDKNAMGSWLVSTMTELNAAASQYDIEAGHIYTLFNPDADGSFGIVDVSGSTPTPNAAYTAVKNYLTAHPSAQCGK